MQVFAALERHGLTWYLTGSQALAAYGAPRQTMDTDVVVATHPGDLAVVAAALSDGYLYAEPIRSGRRWLASLVDRDALGKVDLIIRDPDPWGREAMRRRVRWDHPSFGPIWTSTLEDMVLAKLQRSDGISELHLRDYASLLRLNAGRVDQAYLARWSRALGIADRLQEVRHAP